MPLFPLSERFPRTFGAQASYPQTANLAVYAAFFSVVAFPLLAVSAKSWVRLALVMFTVLPAGGFGLDLRRRSLSGAVLKAMVFAVGASAVFNALYELVLRPSNDRSAASDAAIIWVLLSVMLFVMILGARWCSLYGVRKAFRRGTSGYNEDDRERRRQIIEAFKRRERQ